MSEYNINMMAEYSNYSMFTSVGPHRDCQWYDLVKYKDSSNPLVGVIDGYDMVVCRLSRDGQWWVVPQSENHESHIDDIGPFENLGDAVLHLKLHSTKIYDN